MDKLKWHTEQRKVKDLIPWEGNPRKASEKQVSDMDTSLDRFDLVEVPAIDLDNVLVAGHFRQSRLMAKGRGEELIDVRVPNRKLTTEEFKEYNLRSNKNTGEFDWDMIAQGFEVQELLDVGFTQDEIDLHMFANEEKLPDLEEGNDEALTQVTLVFTPQQKEDFDNILVQAKEKLFVGQSGLKDGDLVHGVLKAWGQNQ